MKKILVLGLLIGAVWLTQRYYLRPESKSDLPVVSSQPASVEGSPLLTEIYTESDFGYSIKMPKGYIVESEGKYTKRFRPDVSVVGVGPTNFVYVSVVPPVMKERVGEVYNYTPDHISKLMMLKDAGQSINVAKGDVDELGQWYTYTLVAIEEINGREVKNYQNSKPWEFPAGTEENKLIFTQDDKIYILGYYTGGEGVASGAMIDPRVAYSMVKSFEPK